MIKIDKLTYGRPEKEIYNKLSFEIEDDAHYAFIGTNGCGKSTLIDMIINPDEYLFKGKIEFDDNFKNTRIGYVSQFDNRENSREMTVFEYISDEFVRLQDKIAELCERMATETELEAVFDEYQRALDENDAIDGDNYESNIRKQLKLASLEKLENQQIGKLSGGEFKLVQVVKELLLSPKLLFMDEPDVFLDFERINALKELINAHKGTLVVITHNRYLLNHCFDHILHLENADIQAFEGSYVDYNIELLSTKIELLEAAARDENEINRQQEILDRLRKSASYQDNASLGSRVHARQTIVDRLTFRKTKLPFIDIKSPKIDFPACAAPEEEFLLKVENYEAAFEEQLLDKVSFEMKAGDKVAVIGKNGSGKTTFLRDLFKAEKPSIKLAPGAVTQMFSQNIRNEAEDEKTLSDLLVERGLELIPEQEAFAKHYGIVKEGLYKRLKDFSGGERDLIKLALMTLTESNFLLLDEPTGHLDLYAQTALEDAVKRFKGSVLMVSHDFYTVVNCADYVLFVENNGIRRMSTRKFRQMIYEQYFDKDYLAREEKRKALEIRVASMIADKDYESAKLLLETTL